MATESLTREEFIRRKKEAQSEIERIAQQLTMSIANYLFWEMKQVKSLINY